MHPPLALLIKVEKNSTASPLLLMTRTFTVGEPIIEVDDSSGLLPHTALCPGSSIVTALPAKLAAPIPGSEETAAGWPPTGEAITIEFIAIG